MQLNPGIKVSSLKLAFIEQSYLDAVADVLEAVAFLRGKDLVSVQILVEDVSNEWPGMFWFTVENLRDAKKHKDNIRALVEAFDDDDHIVSLGLMEDKLEAMPAYSRGYK